MTITQKYDGDKLGQKFAVQVNQFAADSATATQQAARRAASEIEDQCRANIRAAGSSVQLQDGLTAALVTTGTTLAIRVTHSAPYWTQFEEGRVIQGRPLLWIPVSSAPEALGINAKDFPVPLFRVDRVGRVPLLVKAGGKPMYFGKPSITIPKKWDLREIVRQVAGEMDQFYKEALRGG